MAEPKWWYAQGNQRKGPVPLDALKALVARGEVTAKDLVWREGMPGWVAASTVDELTAAAPSASDSPTAETAGHAPAGRDFHLETAPTAPNVSRETAAAGWTGAAAPETASGMGNGASDAATMAATADFAAAEPPAELPAESRPETRAAVTGDPLERGVPPQASPPPVSSAAASAAAAEPAPGTGDAFWNDLWIAVSSVMRDPLGGQRAAYQRLGRFRSMKVGAALLLFWAVVTVFSGVAIAWKGAAATRAAEAFGFAGFLRLLLFVVLTPLVGVGAMGLLRRAAKGTGSLDSDIFLTGVASLPFTLMTALLPMLGFSTFVAVGVEAFAAVLAVIVLLAGQTRVVGLTERAAAWGVPLTVALVAAVVSTLLDWLL